MRLALYTTLNMAQIVLQENTFTAENGEKGMQNMRFRAFLGNQPLDFSDFWYETSVIYYLKYSIGSFVRDKFRGPKMVKLV